MLVSELKLKYEALHVEWLLRLKPRYWLTWLGGWTSRDFKPQTEMTEVPSRTHKA